MNCLHCNNLIENGRIDKKFCNDKCRDAYWKNRYKQLCLKASEMTDIIDVIMTAQRKNTVTCNYAYEYVVRHKETGYHMLTTDKPENDTCRWLMKLIESEGKLSPNLWAYFKDRAVDIANAELRFWRDGKDYYDVYIRRISSGSKYTVTEGNKTGIRIVKFVEFHGLDEKNLPRLGGCLGLIGSDNGQERPARLVD